MNYFGTDGIRDRVDGPHLQPGFVRRVGRALGQWLGPARGSTSRHVAIGRDTRASGQEIMVALATGLHEAGIRIFDAGVCPTPAVAAAVRALDLDLGIVVTASHNPASDNGIKLFSSSGTKLSESEESAIEAAIAASLDQAPVAEGSPPVQAYEARRHYVEQAMGLLDNKSLMGLRIALDTANGATYQTSGEILAAYGAQVIQTGDRPDGRNINDGVGSEFPGHLADLVRSSEADIGISHDGDGDRVILCDHSGEILDGDAVLAILGDGWARRGELSPPTVVATIMSNLGLDQCLRNSGVETLRAGVGDRQVFEAMKASGSILGGESSGHFIAMPYLPTGDGLLAALLVLREMMLQERSLRDLAAGYQPFPQLKRNLRVREKIPLGSLPGLKAGLADLETDLKSDGRILLRYSGTEHKIRLLAEAPDADRSRETLARLESLVREHLSIED
jgi:phosphoglucosamine mutase